MEPYPLQHAVLTLKDVIDIEGPNYQGVEAHITFMNDQKTFIMTPQKRFYTFRNIVITETAIEWNLWRDWYVALGEPVSEAQDSWSFRVQYKPMIRLIWLGGILMAAGMLAAVMKRRQR